MLRRVSVAALVAVVAAGCGSSASRPHTSPRGGVPRALAQRWERQALEIATAADAGDDCRAIQLASALQSDVVAQAHRLPFRLRAPLVTSVTSLAGRLTCRTTVTVETTPKKAPGKHKPPHKHKDDHERRGKGGDG